MMMLRSPKTKTLADWLIERTSSTLHEIEPKRVRKAKTVINRGKRSKILSEVKPAKNKSESA